jgi:hypothetical protein
LPNRFVSRTVADAPSATSEKLNNVRRVRESGYKTEGRSAHLGVLGLSAGRDIQPSISIAILIATFLYYESISRVAGGESRRDTTDSTVG